MTLLASSESNLAERMSSAWPAGSMGWPKAARVRATRAASFDSEWGVAASSAAWRGNQKRRNPAAARRRKFILIAVIHGPHSLGVIVVPGGPPCFLRRERFHVAINKDVNELAS